MALHGEYEPSPTDRIREQVELYEATNGTEGGTLKWEAGYCADHEGGQVWR
jgi:hypothetical protein